MLASDDPACLSFWNALDQPIAQTMMGPLAVVVLHVLRDRSPQMPLAEDHQAIQALGLDREHESLRVGVQIRTSRRQPHRGDANTLENRSPRARVDTRYRRETAGSIPILPLSCRVPRRPFLCSRDVGQGRGRAAVKLLASLAAESYVFNVPNRTRCGHPQQGNNDFIDQP